jgi:predicted ATPase
VADFGEDVALVELAPLVDPDDVPQALGVALGLRDQAGISSVQLLVEYLRGRHSLLVVDNCEHVIGASAKLVAALLSSCPRLTVLTTSRQPLRTNGEVVWRVPSLAVPVVDRAFVVAVDPTDVTLDYPAVRLFLDRAQAVHPGFLLNKRNVFAVVDICSRLDGIPLAIELAAALVGDLSVELIVERLNGSFSLLTWGDRAALPRQQTLHATIDWSYGLLPEIERRLFRRLAVFAGGFTLDAAEGVCTGNGLAHGDVLPLLIRLVDKSLVVADETADGALRYRLLETLRQFEWAELERSGEADVVQRQHRDWFLTLAERAKPELMGYAATTELQRLESEHDNVRAALGWC